MAKAGKTFKVTYIGDHVRHNSFGTFHPNQSYQVTEEVALQLLKAKIYFVSDEIALPVKSTPPVITAPSKQEEEETEEITDDIEDEYTTMTKAELQAVCTSRGITFPKKVSREELQGLLRLPELE